MANQNTVQITPVKEIQDIDECCENIPPGVVSFPGTSKLLDQDKDVTGCFPAWKSGENDPRSVFSTPAPAGANPKTGLCGFQSSLTPILKQLNIHKYSSPPPHENSSHLPAPSLSLCNTVTNSQNAGSIQPSNADITGTFSRRSLGDANTPVCWLADECMPEITFLDVTCDTTVQLSKNDSAPPDSMPPSPLTTGFVRAFNTPKPLVNKKPDVIQSKGAGTFCPQTNSPNRKLLCKQSGEGTASETSSNNQTSQQEHPSRLFHATQDHSQVAEVSKGETMAGKDSMMVDVPESVDAPLRWLDDRFFPEITLLDVTHDSDFSPKGEMPPLEVKQDVAVGGLPNNLPSSALGGEVEVEPGTQDTITSENLSSTVHANVTETTSSLCEQSDNSVVKNTPKNSVNVTRDISMESALEDSRPSFESSGQSTRKIQTSGLDTPGVHPVNVTRDISSASDMSVDCVASHTQDIECSTSSQNVTSEAHCQPGATSTNVTSGQELLTSHPTSRLTAQNQKPTGSVNDTFTIVPQSNQDTSAPALTQIHGLENETLDLPTSNASSPKAQKDVNKPTKGSKNDNESSPGSVQNFSSGMPSDRQNSTFEKLQISTGSTILGGVGATNISSQNNTFTMKSPKQNGTITISETSSRDSQQSSLDKASPQKSPNKGCVESIPPDTTKKYQTTVTHSDTMTVNVHETQSNPTETASAAAQLDTKDSSHPGLSMKDSFPDTSCHHSLDADENKATTFNLDDTLDLRGDALITSTPMVTCKMFNFSTEREDGKPMAAQKKLYEDGPSKPDHQVHSEVPSNIVCDRKTFLAKPAAKSMLPPLKTASQLLRYRPASALPGRPEHLMSGLPVTRQKTQAAALRNSDPSHVTTGKPVSYNFRPTTTGSRQPIGLLNPRLSGIQAGTLRAAQGLRPPSARANTAASSSTDGLRGPTVTNPATKMSQVKKQSLTRVDPLPVAKRKKMDSSLQPEASTTSCDASKRAKTLKPPTAAPKVLPAKLQRVDAAVPASTAEASLSCNAVSRVRALKQQEAAHKAVLPKAQIQSCVGCAALQQQLDVQSEEIRRLKDELKKCSQPHEEC
eukprot:XP_011601144.1 PREDICTED: uncharacterized protein LOC105416310 [Takifugu rubripes]